MTPSNPTTKPLPHPKYRPDIDGLRAVAVLAVVGFHAFPTVLKGGFVGVDIFFVISGFLISSILWGSIKERMFSFKEFYVRRILRIFPALALVLSVCYAAGWLVLLPEEFQQLGKHIAAGVGFVSNLFFWQEAGYFDNLAETKPLLHLWSLGVEEQFYIIWPCVLLLAWRLRFNQLALSLAMIAASLAFSVDKVYTDAVQAFYSPVTRFWELLLGGLLAYVTLHHCPLAQSIDSVLRKFSPHKRPGNPALLNHVLSILGGLLILSAVIFVHRNKPFPGFWALLPTLGAYLIISAGPVACFNRCVLSTRMMVWVGLISYPLYLWHWPLLSFATVMESRTPAVGIRLVAVALAFALAWLTYRFVEQPLRFGKRSKAKISGLVLAMLLMGVLGVKAYLNPEVRASALTEAMVHQAEELKYPKHWEGWSLCPDEGESAHCKILDPGKPAGIVLIGDSHAGHLASGLAGLKGSVKNIAIRSGAGCMPVYEFEESGQRYFSCEGNVIGKALDEAINSKTIKAIMLSGYGMLQIQQDKKDMPLDGYAHTTTPERAQKNADVLQKALDVTLARLVASGKKIVFWIDVPELDFDPKECVTIRPVYLHPHTDKTPCAISRAGFEQRAAAYHRIIQQAEAKFPTVKFLKTYESLCDQTFCYAAEDGELWYMSRDHLTRAGSRRVVGHVARVLSGL